MNNHIKMTDSKFKNKKIIFYLILFVIVFMVRLSKLFNKVGPKYKLFDDDL